MLQVARTEIRFAFPLPMIINLVERQRDVRKAVHISNIEQTNGKLTLAPSSLGFSYDASSSPP